MKLSTIIINYNTPAMTERALESLSLATLGFEHEIILIENASTERVSDTAIEGYNLKVLRNSENLGFARAVNQGIKETSGDYILLLNSDVLLKKEALGMMLKAFDDGDNQSQSDQEEIGIVGPKLVYPTGITQATFGNAPTLLNEFLRFSMLSKLLPWGTLTYPNYFTRSQFGEAHQVAWLSGGCLLIKRSVFEEIRLFDEAFYFGVEDIDFCLRANQAGIKVVYEPGAIAIHHHGFSSGGKRSVWSATNEMNGFAFLIAKHWPEKKLFLLGERLFYKIRLFKYRIFN